MITLRDYQIEALDAIHRDLQTEPCVLLQAVTGAGKTVTACRLVSRYYHETIRRFLILAHKQELVQQFQRTFGKMTPVPSSDIGICCAGLDSRDINRRITIATVQTFAGLVGEYRGCDLLIIDEAHRVSIGTDSMYDLVIATLRAARPNMRLLGITATPSRLEHGYIYGDRCKPGARNLFPRLNHKISYARLKRDGHLCELRGKVAHDESLAAQLEGVKITSGEWNLGDLGEVMGREVHIRTAVDAIREHCGGYRHVCVFCCTIEHAERLARELGDDCTTLHSRLGALARQINLDAWTAGHKRICTSVNILAEGFDFPPLDCLVMARPTLSGVLYVQAVGRALRTSPGKGHAYLLDLTTNTERFGTDLDNVRVQIPRALVKEIEKTTLNKVCPSCQSEMHKALVVCSSCGYEWPKPELVEAASAPNLKDAVFSSAPPAWVKVHGMAVDIHASKKSEKVLGKIALYLDQNPYRPKTVRLFFPLPDFYDGFAVQKSRERWAEIAPTYPLPDKVEDFVAMRDVIRQPERILLDESGEWPEVLQMRFDGPTGLALDDDVPF